MITPVKKTVRCVAIRLDTLDSRIVTFSQSGAENIELRLHTNEAQRFIVGDEYDLVLTPHIPEDLST
jgi:hypothetical protein